MPQDVLNTVAQPVATRKAVFMPTNHGMLYALAAKDGKELWKARIGNGCFHSAAVENGRVFAASLEGDVVAFDSETGAELWRTHTPGLAGFVTAPLLAEARVFLGDMDGNMLAIEQSNGKIAWATDLGAPIVQSAAYDGGRVYVGAQDMRMRALDAKKGETVWTSDQISGMSMEPYYPVICQGYVVVRTMPLSSELGWNEPEIGIFAPIAEWEKFLAARPERQDMFVLDANTGREAFKVPHQQIRRRGESPVPPPCVDPEGKLIIPICADFGRGWEGATWGRLDLATRAVELIGKAAEMDEGMKIQPYAGGNPDETNLFSAGGRIVFFAHDLESGQGEFCGYYDLDKKKWWSTGIGTPQGRFWGNHPHQNDPAAYKGLLGFRGFCGYSNGGHAYTITANRLYHHTFEVLAAWGSAAENGE